MLNILIGLLATAVVAGGVLAFFHERRRRDVDEMRLELRIRERLLADQSLAPWPLSVRVRLPWWRRSPAVVALTGRVPSPALRDAARQLTARVLSTRYPRVKTIARIVVDSPGYLAEVAPVAQPITPAPDVLIAEDDDASRTGLEILLKRWGYRVETATDGQTALEKALALHPSLVITDVTMPRLDGLEVLRVLQRDRAETPVILLTGQDAAGRLRRTGEGPYGYLSKPVEVEQLRRLVAKALTPHEHVTAVAEGRSA
jgi:CheY-like chemotaxis protein